MKAIRLKRRSSKFKRFYEENRRTFKAISLAILAVTFVFRECLHDYFQDKLESLNSDHLILLTNLSEIGAEVETLNTTFTILVYNDHAYNDNANPKPPRFLEGDLYNTTDQMEITDLKTLSIMRELNAKLPDSAQRIKDIDTSTSKVNGELSTLNNLQQLVLSDPPDVTDMTEAINLVKEQSRNAAAVQRKFIYPLMLDTVRALLTEIANSERWDEWTRRASYLLYGLGLLPPAIGVWTSRKDSDISIGEN